MIRWFRRRRPKRLTPDEITVLHLREMFEALPKPEVQIPTPPRQINPKYTKIQRKYF